MSQMPLDCWSCCRSVNVGNVARIGLWTIVACFHGLLLLMQTLVLKLMSLWCEEVACLISWGERRDSLIEINL